MKVSWVISHAFGIYDATTEFGLLQKNIDFLRVDFQIALAAQLKETAQFAKKLLFSLFMDKEIIQPL